MSSYNSAALLGGQRLEKGSTAAKARMAYLRSLRGKKLHAGAVAGAGARGGKRRTRALCGSGATADGLMSLIGKALGKSIGFWADWGKTNIGGLVSYIKNKKQRQKIIDELKKLPPAELKKFQAMMRAKRDGKKEPAPAPQPEPPAPIQQKTAVQQAMEEARRQYDEALKERDRKLLEIMQKKYERSKRQRKQAITQTMEDEYDYDEEQPDNVQEIEDAVDETDDMAVIPRSRYRGGKLGKRDILDIFLGPYGWAALASRKIQEKKAKKQQAELDNLMYGNE